MASEAIKQQQTLLKSLGLYDGPIDGISGPATQAAIQTYELQRQRQEAEQRQAQQRAMEQQQQLEAQRAQNEARQLELQQQQAQQQAIDAERRRTQEDFERSAGGQAYEIGKYAVPLAGGYLGGHLTAKGIERRQGQMAPHMLPKSAAGRFAPYAAAAGARFLPEAALALGTSVPLEEGTLKDIMHGAGAGLSAAGLATLGEGAIKAFTPPKEMTPFGAAPPIEPPPAKGAPDIDEKIDTLKRSMSRQQLADQAARFKIKHTTKDTKTSLARKIVESGKRMPKGALKAVSNPIAAGSLAGGLFAADRAEAAGLNPLEQAGTAIGAGAATGGSVYGLGKAGQAVGRQLAKTGIGRAAMSAAPLGLAGLAATDAADYFFPSPGAANERLDFMNRNVLAPLGLASRPDIPPDRLRMMQGAFR